ncbi:nucleotidyltransferase family protein [Mucilaginibacter segetis]|uniref:Nucleotidyltransferase family protein n=1 Tax=Mucilaginibacter segetis TaxID=2793071 RepID=A0A934PSY1_9SPHI|nr:nucleotidyltransferase family protein [Mucilaginibacter segetis]MBK0379036.1 nucleotidyltransferase family protein [Mucilaginibacter segetis]
MTAIVILAAGSSSRLGRPKQTLEYKGQTLLQIAIKNALAVTEMVLVVLGANAEHIEPTIENLPANVLHNAHWEEGMSSSIRLAITDLEKNYPEVTSVIVMLCDQPFANAELLTQLIDKKKTTGKGIIASNYHNISGVPALFEKKYFPQLLELSGQAGAKQLLTQYPDAVAEVPFPEGETDIDTTEDYKRLNQKLL